MRRAPLILIVEDDRSTRAMYRDYLDGSGFRTADAHNGFQALEKARELRPDAILTDLAVPGMDGFAFGRALKELPATRDIPILAMTGHPEYLLDHDRIKQAGLSRVLSKPCDLDTVVRELRYLVESSQSAAAPPPAP